MMNNSLVDIVSTSIQSAVNPELWNKTLDLLVDSYGAKSSALIVLDPKHESRLSLAMSRFLRVDAYETFKRFMQRDDADDQVAVEQIYQVPENSINSEYDLFGVHDYRDLPHSSFRDWMKQQFDIAQRYSVKLNQHGPWLDCLLLHTDSQKNLLLEREVTEINQLSTILSSSLKTFRVMEQLRSQFNATLNALDKLGMACFLTIDNAQVIHKNKKALELINQDDGISITPGGHFSVIEKKQDERIVHHCYKAFLSANAKHMMSECLIPINRPSGKAPYLMIINPVIDANAELEAGLKCALVFIVDPEAATHLSVQGLVRLGHLTPAETAICEMLVQGLSTEKIMKIRDVTENTIRQQIKTILAKLNCNNRINLLRLAIDTRLPVSDRAS